MKRRDDINSNSDPTNTQAQGDAEKRCRWQTGTGRCTNTLGTKLMVWGGGKSSWICETHWDDREELRPASLVQWRAAMLAMQKIQKCGHIAVAREAAENGKPMPAHECNPVCIHRQEYERRFAR